MWCWKPSFPHQTLVKVLDTIDFLLLTCILTELFWCTGVMKPIVFNSTSFIWEQHGAFTWKTAVSGLMSIGWSFCHNCYINQRLSSALLPCLSPPTKVDKPVIYGYPITIHSFHLYLSRVGSTVYLLNASRLAGIQSRQIADLSCHLALNRTSMGHWTKSSRSQIQHLKIGWHFLSIHNLGGVTILKTFKLA